MTSLHTAMTADGLTCGCDACRSAGVQPRAAAWDLPRRRMLVAGAALLAGGGSILAARGARAQTSLSPAAAMDELAAGNARFVANKMTSFKEDLPALRHANEASQAPFAAVLSCADSRVPPELVFDQSLGRLFVTRVAGNVATTEVIASLEYGAAVLGVKAILVLGHQGCGAVKAAVAGGAEPGQITALYPPLRAAVDKGGADTEAVGKANARIQADLLATASPVLAGLVKDGALKIGAGYYSLADGKVSMLA